jgi:rhamnose utilization protein RhaD (predicted bifunctional aldolase and dehydrogenase)/NAD(P)-dependent dehydrogenase (short-subunit alcohol dehydrogenase family)
VEQLYNEEDSISFVTRYAAYPKELALRVYTSRLIGSDRRLVLHGGGNTSVKLKLRNIMGEVNDVLFVKGSGRNLDAIEPEGFVGLNLNPIQKLRQLPSLSDSEMDNQLKINRIAWQSPEPSVETLLHAFIPHQYVDHTHADAILILTNLKKGKTAVREALGDRIAIVPYTMSGFSLAKAAAAAYERRPGIDAVIIMNHGIFTFAGDAKTSYEKMIGYVNRAEGYIRDRIRNKPLFTRRADLTAPKNDRLALARLCPAVRGACAHTDSGGGLRRFYVETRNATDLVDASLSEEAQRLCRSGVLTPDHVIRTKNTMVNIESIPENDTALKMLVQQKIIAFKNSYHRYFRRQVKTKGIHREEMDAYPRLFLVAGLGLVALGFTRNEACIAADIGEHTIRAKLRSFAMGDYSPIPDSHVFDMEYWPLQQKKLNRLPPLPLQGQVAVITGGGGAIAVGIAERVLSAGAAVVMADIDPSRLNRARSILAEKYEQNRVESIEFDVTDYRAVENGFAEITRRLGGIDIVVPNAGIAYVAKIDDMDPDKLDRVIAVNFKGTYTVIKASIPVFRRQGTGGNIVVISSKNVFDPGAAFGAYSASKAGAHQISKIAALELAELGVRVNMVNPDAVFGDERVSSKLWDLIGPERMKARGLDPGGLREYYRRRSLLKVPVLAEHVGNAVVFFASNQTPTTGATLPVDAGIPAAFPR